MYITHNHFSLIHISRGETSNNISIVQTLIHSKLDYGNGLLVGCHLKDIQRLQRLQNYAARLVFLLRKYDRISLYRKELHWLPVKQRTQYKVLLYTFKCFNSLAPEFMCDMVNVYKPHRKLRSSMDTTRLVEPSTKLVTANRAFYAAVIPRTSDDSPISMTLKTN